MHIDRMWNTRRDSSVLLSFISFQRFSDGVGGIVTRGALWIESGMAG